MQDQVDALSALGVRAGFLNSTQQSFERRKVEDAYLAGELDLLYLAPERLRVRETIELLDRGTVALFAIDEAHCVSQWGHDFRPDYLQLSMLHERWPEVPRIALTATATDQTHAEIAQRLQLGEARHFVASFDRPNIQYRIAPKDKPRDQLLNLLRTEHEGDAGIVYCLSRNSVEQTAQFLVERGVTALPYHAGLDRQVRARNQSRFLREDGVVMVATIAFGMGIDKPDVRFVAHLDLPKSVEGYYQETGRAGRDGLPSTAWLAYGLADVVQQRRMIDTSEGDAAHKRRLTAHLDAMLALCETVECRRVQLLNYFGQPSQPCGNCDTCLTPPESWDGTVAAQKLLSTVVRLEQRGQRYGAGHLVDILRGKVTPRITSLGPRVAEHVRCGRRRVRRRVARRGPPAAGHGAAGRRLRRLRHHPPGARQRRGPARRADGPPAARDREGRPFTRLAREGGRHGRPVRRGRRRVRGAAGVARGRRQGAGRARLRGVPRRDAARGGVADADVAGGARRRSAGSARPSWSGTARELLAVLAEVAAPGVARQRCSSSSVRTRTGTRSGRLNTDRSTIAPPPSDERDHARGDDDVGCAGHEWAGHVSTITPRARASPPRP